MPCTLGRGAGVSDPREESSERVPASPERVLLPEKGVKELADRLTEYLTRIELADTPEVMGQVLDDILTQCGGIPEQMDAPDALDEIVNHQLAVTMAFQLGRLAGRSPQLVERFVQEAFEKWGILHLDSDSEVTVEDFDHLAERVLPKLRRWRYYLEGE